MKKNNKGFSLAELIVVVLILGILAVAITPQVMNWIDKSKVAKDENYAGTVATAVESVALEWIGEGKASSITSPLTVVTGSISETSGHSHTAGECFACDAQSMIGATKCKAPEQSGMTKFTVTIVQNGKTADVTVAAAP